MLKVKISLCILFIVLCLCAVRAHCQSLTAKIFSCSYRFSDKKIENCSDLNTLIYIWEDYIQFSKPISKRYCVNSLIRSGQGLVEFTASEDFDNKQAIIKIERYQHAYLIVSLFQGKTVSCYMCNITDERFYSSTGGIIKYLK